MLSVRPDTRFCGSLGMLYRTLTRPSRIYKTKIKKTTPPKSNCQFNIGVTTAVLSVRPDTRFCGSLGMLYRTLTRPSRIYKTKIKNTTPPKNNCQFNIGVVTSFIFQISWSSIVRFVLSLRVSCFCTFCMFCMFCMFYVNSSCVK